jgi:hypothetical protein
MFTKKIRKLHEEYGRSSTRWHAVCWRPMLIPPGPIVRINPWELHIDDPEFYETIYAPSAPYDKLQVFENRFSIPTAAFSTADHVAHKRRRAALSPFFTKSKVQGHGPFIQSLVDTVCRRLTEEYQGQERPLTLNDMFACLSADVITSLAFGHAPQFCESQDWKTPFTKAMDDLVASTHINTQFPFMVPLTNAIPQSLLAKSPAFEPVITFRQVCSVHV